MKLKWLRSLNRYGDVCYTSGVYEIQRVEFDLPVRSIEYRVTKGGKRIGREYEFSYLTDAKDYAESDDTGQ
jgi:hypothetical protein